jgi:hypothetical protein
MLGRCNIILIKSNSTDAEHLMLILYTSFDSDGFSLGNDSAINGSGKLMLLGTG